jgi:hypothetical protein
MNPGQDLAWARGVHIALWLGAHRDVLHVSVDVVKVPPNAVEGL